jgi:hypothetical protein
MSMATENPMKGNDAPRPRKKRGAVFIVIAASIGIHLLAGGVLAVIKITEVIRATPDFEAPPVEVVKPPPPPPPPPPTTMRTQKSMPRPQPLAAQNPQNLDIPAIEIDRSNLNMLSGRGFGGGLGKIGGGVLESFNITSFGFDRYVEGTLEGTLFDFKTDKKGKPIDHAWGNPEKGFPQISKEFTRTFNIKNLERDFFTAENKLFASYFAIPFQPASIAPESFGAADVIKPTLIGAVYKGSFVPRESGRFRFVGRGDDVFVVRLNGKIVLDGSWRAKQYYSDWKQSEESKQADQERAKKNYFGFTQPAITGDGFMLRKGEPTELELMLVEVPGGKFGGYLLIEKESGESGPKLFSTLPLSDADKNFLRRVHPDAAALLD